MDKSIPYSEILMERKKGSESESFYLPEGFRFVFYEEGDERYWSIIETLALEFNNPIDGYIYFQKNFLPFKEELKRRMVFIVNNKEEKIATATAWWTYLGKKRVPRLHWVGVTPEYQGLGLGKAIVFYITNLMIEIEGDVNFYLSTQTWSYKGINIYKKFGYKISPIKDFLIKENNCKKSIEILNSLNN